MFYLFDDMSLRTRWTTSSSGSSSDEAAPSNVLFKEADPTDPDFFRRRRRIARFLGGLDFVSDSGEGNGGGCCRISMDKVTSSAPELSRCCKEYKFAMKQNEFPFSFDHQARDIVSTFNMIWKGVTLFVKTQIVVPDYVLMLMTLACW